MKTICIIPARYGSTRIKAKPLIKIYGQTLLQITYEAVKKSKLFDQVFIATDSKKIKTIAANFGAICHITSPKCKNGSERCAELVKTLSQKINAEDLIINMQCDEPFIQKSHLKNFIELLKTINNNNFQIGTIVCPIKKSDISNDSVVKAHINNGENIVRNFTRKISKEYSKIYQHVGIYGYKANVLLKLAALAQAKREKEESLEQLRWLENGYKICCSLIKENISSINTHNDIKKL